VARAEAEAQRLIRKARDEGTKEPFERHLADAYALMLSGSGTSRAKRPELVVLVSHEVARRGWSDVTEGEMCKIRGLGPVSPAAAKEIASDAFLTGVFTTAPTCDGSSAGRATSQSRCVSLWSWDQAPSSTVSCARAVTDFEPSSITSGRARRGVPLQRQPEATVRPMPPKETARDRGAGRFGSAEP